MSEVTSRNVIEGLDEGAAARLDSEGFLVLRGAIPAAWLPSLTSAFEAGFIPSDQWPAPRGADWRHALVDLDPVVQRVCQLPNLLSAVHRLFRQPFFLAQVEGREPRQGGRAQTLHRDGAGGGPLEVISALAFLDPYGVDNGATRVAPGSHRDLALSGDGRPTITVEGAAGDILVFDADLLHGGTLNTSGAPRRSLLINYFAAPLLDRHRTMLALRNIRMPIGGLIGS